MSAGDPNTGPPRDYIASIVSAEPSSNPLPMLYKILYNANLKDCQWKAKETF